MNSPITHHTHDSVTAPTMQRDREKDNSLSDIDVAKKHNGYMVHIRLHLNTMSLEQTLALASALVLVEASVQAKEETKN